MTSGSEITSLVKEAIDRARATTGRVVVLETPPQVLDYAMDLHLISDAVLQTVRAVPEDALDPVTLTVSNVEVEFDEDADPSPTLWPGKHLGLTLRWLSTGTPADVPPGLDESLSQTRNYAYAVDRDGEASISVLLRDRGWAPDGRGI